MTQVSQSLAGRTAVLRRLPFTLAEVARLKEASTARSLAQTLLEGFYPRIHDRGLEFTNSGKRLIRTPKLYFHDVGLACWLLGLPSADQVSRDPLWGSLFENFVVLEALMDRLNPGESPEMYFYLAQLAGGCVVFGGDEGQSRSDWPVHAWRRLQAGRHSAEQLEHHPPQPLVHR